MSTPKHDPGESDHKLRENKEAEDGLRKSVADLRATTREAADLLQRRRDALAGEYRLRRRGKG